MVKERKKDRKDTIVMGGKWLERGEIDVYLTLARYMVLNAAESNEK